MESRQSIFKRLLCFFLRPFPNFINSHLALIYDQIKNKKSLTVFAYPDFHNFLRRHQSDSRSPANNDFLHHRPNQSTSSSGVAQNHRHAKSDKKLQTTNGRKCSNVVADTFTLAENQVTSRRMPATLEKVA